MSGSIDDQESQLEPDEHPQLLRECCLLRMIKRDNIFLCNFDKIYSVEEEE